jgi:hypothetical protein
MEGATTVAGSIYSLGNGRDSITLDAGNNVAVDIRSSATDASGAIASLVDVGAANTAGFVSATTDFDYNGALNNDGVTTVTTSAAATITAALANDNDATNFLAALAGGNDALEAALTTYAGAQTAANANAAEAAAITAIGAVANLDSLLTSSEAVLFTVDSETNDSAGVANDGASAVFRFVNSTTTGNAINTGELELIFVTQDGALVAGDFI